MFLNGLMKAKIRREMIEGLAFSTASAAIDTFAQSSDTFLSPRIVQRAVVLIGPLL
jgi:hypothetical protein